MKQTLEKIQASQLLNAWQKYVYDKFDEIEMGQKEVFKRRRTLGLEMPIDRKFSFKEIPELNDQPDFNLSKGRVVQFSDEFYYYYLKINDKSYKFIKN